jgi:hypothetical protein
MSCFASSEEDALRAQDGVHHRRRARHAEAAVDERLVVRPAERAHDEIDAPEEPLVGLGLPVVGDAVLPVDDARPGVERLARRAHAAVEDMGDPVAHQRLDVLGLGDRAAERDAPGDPLVVAARRGAHHRFTLHDFRPGFPRLATSDKK